VSEQPPPSEEPVHIHIWDILDRWTPETSPHPRLRTGRVTIVLIQCKICNLPQTIELEGTWTLQQLRHNDAQIERRDHG
jgi:hypothetical protein